MTTPLSALHVPDAKIAMCIALEDGPTHTAIFEAGRITELLSLYEGQQKITDRQDHQVHGHQHRLLLSLVLNGNKTGSDDWQYMAAIGFLWCGFNHPTLGDDLRRRASIMLREIRRTTMMFDIRDRALYFDVTPEPFPQESKPNDAHDDPDAPTA